MSKSLIGFVERITFRSEEGFAVVKLKVANREELVVTTGALSSVQLGEEIAAKGEWKNHSKHGPQFEVLEFSTKLPSEVTAIRKYLASGWVKGIGPTFAQRIVDKFGGDTLRVIDEETSELLLVPGIGSKRVRLLEKCWKEQKFIRTLMLFLTKYEISASYALKIYKVYKEQSIEKIQQSPYLLAKDIFGIGFKTADRIALKLGISPESPQRIQAGIEHVLWEYSSEGHTCCLQEELFEITKKSLDLEPSLIESQLPNLIETKRIIQKENFIWLSPLYFCEQGIAKQLEKFITTPAQLRPFDSNKALQWLEGQLSYELAKQQEQAVLSSLTEKAQIITGGPGTGKSTILNAILLLFSKLTKKIVLAAPTGKAAKRMTEITGRKAFTIHSILEYDFSIGKFKRNEEHTLNCDLIVIDEASMIDTQLMFSLMRAIPLHAKLIFVGDINQLPSVGPGNVLKDLIRSKVLTTTKLDKIFRQAQKSKIVVSAHKVNQGSFPLINNEPGSDFFYIERQDPEEIVEEVVTLATSRLAKKGFDPLKDIQLLTPMKKGVVGTYNLNQEIQKVLTNKGVSYSAFGKTFYQEDRVMQLKNDYDLNLFNGDVGLIKKIDLAEQELHIDFDGKWVHYPFSNLDRLVLSYAVSVHKFQGSECPVIIMPIHTAHFKLLTRNLLYTAITRAKKLFILVGMKKAIAIAVKNDTVMERYTGLKEALEKIRTKT